MTKKTIVAIAVGAIACAAWTSSASAAKHKTPVPPAQAESIPGVNPMTNAPPTPAVANPAKYTPQPGVNPM
jgi:hypothetical protein